MWKSARTMSTANRKAMCAKVVTRIAPRKRRRKARCKALVKHPGTCNNQVCATVVYRSKTLSRQQHWGGFFQLEEHFSTKPDSVMVKYCTEFYLRTNFWSILSNQNFCLIHAKRVHRYRRILRKSTERRESNVAKALQMKLRKACTRKCSEGVTADRSPSKRSLITCNNR